MFECKSANWVPQRPLLKLTAVELLLLGNKMGCHSSLPPARSLTHQVLLFVPDGLGMVPHEAHGEQQVNDGEDGVQPKEVVAGGRTRPTIRGQGSRAGGGGRRGPGYPHHTDLKAHGFITTDAPNGSHVATVPLERPCPDK